MPDWLCFPLPRLLGKILDHAKIWRMLPRIASYWTGDDLTKTTTVIIITAPTDLKAANNDKTPTLLEARRDPQAASSCLLSVLLASVSFQSCATSPNTWKNPGSVKGRFLAEKRVKIGEPTWMKELLQSHTRHNFWLHIDKICFCIFAVLME